MNLKWGNESVFIDDEFTRRLGTGKGNTASLLLSTFAINVLALSLPILTLQIYDRILPNQGSGTLPVIITGVCVAIVLEACLRLCRFYVIGRWGARFEHLISCRALNTVIDADYSKIGNYGIGEHLHRMTSVNKLKDFHNGYSLTIYAELCFVPLMFILIVYISGWLVMVPAVILVLFLAVAVIKGKLLREALYTREKADDKRYNFLIEVLEGIHTIKAFSLEKIFDRRYEHYSVKSNVENYKVTEDRADIFNVGSVFSHLMVVCVISFGAWLVLQNSMTTGALIATLLLSGRIMQPVQKALALWVRYQDYVLAKKNITEVLETPQHETFEPSRILEETFPDGRVEIKNLSFTHSNEDTPFLKDINLRVKRGEAVLIRGEHGCGKTTLLNLIAGIYPATSGEIKIDEENIKYYPNEKLINHIGYIQNKPVIFRGTIRDNITCFGQLDTQKVKEVAALFSVDKEVAKLPGGFDTFLSGHEVDNIPNGLKQRIAIVRTLATKPKIILYDNADHNLDKAGYMMMYSLMAQLANKVSMIIVSEDENISNLAQTRYKLENGILVPMQHTDGSNITPYRELRL